MIPPMLKLSRCCVSIMSCSSLAGGYKQDCAIDTLTRCSSLSCLIPHILPPSQIQRISMTGCLCEVNNTFVRSRPGPHKRDHSGFIIGLLDIRLSPIDLLGLLHDPQCFLSTSLSFLSPPVPLTACCSYIKVARQLTANLSR